MVSTLIQTAIDINLKEAYFAGVVIGSTTLLIIIIIMITLLIVVTACMKCTCRRSSQNAGTILQICNSIISLYIYHSLCTAAQEMHVREERIYESPAETIDENILTEIWRKGQGSLYSLALPTDPCPAYDIVGV